jgi:AsmA-like protein
MPPRTRRQLRKALMALVLLGVAAWLVPSYFSAERYRRRLEAGLERALHRPVKFGALAFRLLPRPGFSIWNAVVYEDPDFGSEPFAHIDRIECDLSWGSIWRPRLDFSRLWLDHPSLNLVRNRQGEWNVGKLLFQSGITSPAAATQVGTGSDTYGALDLEAEGARLNFKVGVDKKPFAITDLRARVSIDPGRRRVLFNLAGNPVRTDLSLPTPGEVELSGEWTPGRDLQGPLDASLRTRGALLYDWVPLATGKNPDLYGVLDADVQLTGSIYLLKIEGDSRLTQLHRWEQMPPTDPMPCTIHFRGQFDRKQGRALIESVEAAFMNSHLHFSGSLDKLPQSPELDLVVALERSRLEDLAALGRRLWTLRSNVGMAGRIDGMLAIQGPWRQRRYGGFVGVREAVLRTPSGTFPVSDLDARIDSRGVRLAPVKITLAPHVELLAEGFVDRTGKTPRYDLALSARSAPLRDLLSFVRALSGRSLHGLDAAGVATGELRAEGTAWPLSRPVWSGHAELRAARLLIPGLTEPLNFPRASLSLNDDQFVAKPVVAVIGTTVFAGWLRHRGEWRQPWEFQAQANRLSIEEGSLWFDALGWRKPIPLLERLPGLTSFRARREAASDLFSTLNAHGRFTVSNLTYRALALKEFKSNLEIAGRVIRVSDASFHAGGGHGEGAGLVDFNSPPARVSAEVSVSGINAQAWSSRLPSALQGVRGAVSVSGHLETRGLSREEMADHLRGEANLRIKNFSLGEFDPLNALARENAWGALEPARAPARAASGSAQLEVGSHQVTLKDASVEISGAKLDLTGTYDFGGAVDLEVRADLRQVRRRWLVHGDVIDPPTLMGDVHLAGTLDKMAVAPPLRVSRGNP